MRHPEGYHRNRGPWRPTDRQRAVLELLAEGKTNAEIARTLGISPAGAKWHVSELLAETGCEDRQALARWWREESGRRQTPMLWPAFLIRKFGMAATVGVVALLALWVWMVVGRGGDNEHLPDDPAVGPDGGFLAGGPVEPFEPLFQDFLVALSVEAGNSKSRVELIDVHSGDRLARVEAGYRPMVLVRHAAQELLIASGHQPTDGQGFTKLLEVYDLRGYSMQVKRVMPVPDRLNCKTYCQPMVLSRDERYLYYATRTTDRPLCGAGGDASVCDIHSIVVLDMEDTSAAPISTELPRGCGVPVLTLAGESGAIAACRGQYPVRGGYTVRLGPGGVESDLGLEQTMPESAFVHVFTMSSGDLVQVTEGQVIVHSPAAQPRSARVLPLDLGFRPRVFYLGALELGENRVFLVFDDSEFGHDRRKGFVVFDLETMTIESYGLVPDAEAYLPNGDVVYVLRKGKIEVFDLATGRLNQLASVPGDVGVLLPGR